MLKRFCKEVCICKMLVIRSIPASKTEKATYHYDRSHCSGREADEPGEWAVVCALLVHVDLVGFLIVIGPETFRNFISESSFFIASEECVFVKHSCFLRPVLAIATDLSVLEVESCISFNTGVEVSEKNNVGDMLHGIAKLFRISIGLDLEDGFTFLDSLQLIPEHNRLVSFLVPLALAIKLMLAGKVQ